MAEDHLDAVVANAVGRFNDRVPLDTHRTEAADAHAAVEANAIGKVLIDVE